MTPEKQGVNILRNQLAKNGRNAFCRVITGVVKRGAKTQRSLGERDAHLRAQHSPQANRGELLHELRERVAGLRNEAGATWVQTIETRLSEDILSAILALAPRNPYKAYPVQRINDQQLNALKAAGRD